MSSSRTILLAAVLGSACLCGLGVRTVQWLDLGGESGRGGRAVPVEVAPIERGPIALRRELSGTLEAGERVVVAPRVAGRVEKLLVGLGEQVSNGQPLAELDHAAFVQAVRAARAELAVARANVSEAESRAAVAGRELGRAESLHAQGVVSDAELDGIRASAEAAEARAEVARAGVARAGADLETARIELDYTALVAHWEGEDEHRYVAERHLRGGDPVGANEPVLTIVDLDPLVGVLYVSERDYGQVQVGDPVEVRTDAFPEQRFAGEVSHIAPAFSEDSRQARVELALPNPEHQLRPGMFVRAELVLDAREETTVVPTGAVTRRRDAAGVFLLDREAGTVRWAPVRTGIEEGERVELVDGPTTGEVVTLGVQMVDDGARVTLPDEAQ